jgi:hypothetical protein
MSIVVEYSNGRTGFVEAVDTSDVSIGRPFKCSKIEELYQGTQGEGIGGIDEERLASVGRLR